MNALRDNIHEFIDFVFTNPPFVGTRYSVSLPHKLLNWVFMNTLYLGDCSNVLRDNVTDEFVNPVNI